MSIIAMLATQLEHGAAFRHLAQNALLMLLIKMTRILIPIIDAQLPECRHLQLPPPPPPSPLLLSFATATTTARHLLPAL